MKRREIAGKSKRGTVAQSVDFLRPLVWSQFASVWSGPRPLMVVGQISPKLVSEALQVGFCTVWVAAHQASILCQTNKVRSILSVKLIT